MFVLASRAAITPDLPTTSSEWLSSATRDARDEQAGRPARSTAAALARRATKVASTSRIVFAQPPENAFDVPPCRFGAKAMTVDRAYGLRYNRLCGNATKLVASYQ